MPGQASQTSSSPEYITPTQKKNVMCYVLIEAKGQMLYSYCFSYFLSFEPPPPPILQSELHFSVNAVFE